MAKPVHNALYRWAQRRYEAAYKVWYDAPINSAEEKKAHEAMCRWATTSAAIEAWIGSGPMF